VRQSSGWQNGEMPRNRKITLGSLIVTMLRSHQWLINLLPREPFSIRKQFPR